MAGEPSQLAVLGAPLAAVQLEMYSPSFTDVIVPSALSLFIGTRPKWLRRFGLMLAAAVLFTVLAELDNKHLAATGIIWLYYEALGPGTLLSGDLESGCLYAGTWFLLLLIPVCVIGQICDGVAIFTNMRNRRAS